MRILSIITLLFLSIISYAQIEKLTGPRFGITIISNGSSADILNEGINFDEDENNGYGNTGSAFTTQYGWQWETRFADGGENIIGIVEWVTLIAGLEKGMFLPPASSLVGIRTMKGLKLH